jgi:pimeloyl-ACP methyl ester carboxylesterase
MEHESAHDRAGLLQECKAPLAWIYGKRSFFYTDLAAVELAHDYMTRFHAPIDGVTFVGIEGAAHHVFLDKPLETVDCMRRVFAHWQSGETVEPGALCDGDDPTLKSRL